MIAASCIDCAAPFTRDRDEDWKKRCLRCWAARKAANSPTQTARASDAIVAEVRDHVRCLLSLCHPDRHGGSPLSTKTTAWLLSLRDRLPREAMTT